MTFGIGDRIGAYEITGPLGKGGMGEVYRARDLRLKRDVAIKVLPEEFLRDPARVARFQREAELVASLNHPHIAAIHQLEETGESKVIVLELVEGETLADVIARGPIPVDDALEIGRQIATALAAAHEKGVIHRDLKPANIKLTSEGNVKVLDFGLAKMTQPEQLASNLSHSPTLMSASMPGTIMGTAAYMSPEQARGKDVDRRTDIWAFGCVLFEMLTAQHVFDGETTGDILAGIFKGEPDWQRLPPEIPQNIRRLLRRCLQKDRKERLQDIGDARLEIDDAKNAPSEQPNVIHAGTRKERLVWASALAVMTLLAVIAIVRANRPAGPPPEMRLDITTPSAGDVGSIAISPDGLKIVFEANSGGSRLWLRPIGSTVAKPLAGSDNGYYPFWSPDSRTVGFFADRQLKRIDIDSGLVKSLAPAPTGSGGTWNSDGMILFAPSANARPIYRIPATGGEPVAVTQMDSTTQTSHLLPSFLPDGRHFLFYVSGESKGVYLGDGAGSATRLAIDADAAAVYTAGHLLFLRQGKIFAQRFDSTKLTTLGDPFAVVESQIVTSGYGRAAITASAAGLIAYRTDSGVAPQFTWFDRSGKRIETVSNPDPTSFWDAALSPDGRRLAIARTVANANADVWMIEVGRGILRRLTTNSGNEQRPIWSPDGTQVAFSMTGMGIYQKASSGVGTEAPLFEQKGTALTPLDWSSDGRFILFRANNPQTANDLWALPIAGDRKPFPVIQTRFADDNGQFSPDNDWIAYQSNESGRFEIYIQPFSDPNGKTQISVNGGVQPRWRRDGKELFYIGLDNRLTAAPILFDAKSRRVEAGTPVPLFEMHLPAGVQESRQAYIVSPDGQRFLMNAYPEDATPPITVILNWHP